MDESELLHEIVNVAAGHGGRPDLHEAIDALGSGEPVDDGAQVQEPVQEQVQEDGSAEADA